MPPRFLFVVAYGRSGSTLTQGLLNTLPGVLVRGENNLWLLPFFRSWSGLREFQKAHARQAEEKGVRSAFFGLDEIQPDELIEAARGLALRQLYGNAQDGDVDTLGFKEVLWHRVRPKETEDFFGFFEAVFPDARYVLQSRNHDDVMGSGFWTKQDPESVRKSLRRVESVQGMLRKTRAGRTHDVAYERLTSADPGVVEHELRTLAEFALGRCDDDLMDRMRATLAVGYGPNPFRRGTGDRTAGQLG